MFYLFSNWIGPVTVKDLWIPNPLTPHSKFNNTLLIELYEAIYGLISPIQFKNEVLQQRYLFIYLLIYKITQIIKE